MSIYGGQVCPFLESLSIVSLSTSLAVVLVVLFIGQRLLERLRIESMPYTRRARKVFQYQLVGFILGGVILMVFNTLTYGFPMLSGAKLVLSYTLLGFFAAVDLSLEKEWRINHHLEETGHRINPEERYFSHPRKMAVISIISLILTIGVFFLVITKDLAWLIEVGGKVSVFDAQRSILIEVSFIIVIILVHQLNIIRSYARNFNFFLKKETGALIKATGGQFEVTVPICSNDEFGVMAQYTNLMVEGLKDRTEELQKTQDITILSLASLAETRDNETGNHILRTQRYVLLLADYLKQFPRFKVSLDDHAIDLLFKSAPLHDIGKVGIPDNILLKPAKLTDDEFEIMKKHTILGAESLEIAEERLGRNSFLKTAREIAITHHEKWDGSGYPNGMKEDEIPISGRLMALADVYDALISKRIYKEAYSHEKAKEIILSWKGKNFDPEVVDAFITMENQFIEIASQHKD